MKTVGTEVVLTKVLQLALYLRSWPMPQNVSEFLPHIFNFYCRWIHKGKVRKSLFQNVCFLPCPRNPLWHLKHDANILVKWVSNEKQKSSQSAWVEITNFDMLCQNLPCLSVHFDTILETSSAVIRNLNRLCRDNYRDKNIYGN